MGRSQWIALVFGAFSAFLPQLTSANPRNVPAVRVVLHDSAATSGDLLAEARDFAIGVFRQAGIEVLMATGDQALACTPGASGQFCVQVLLRPKHPQFEPGKVRTMGVALAADTYRAVVSVYLDAVADVARRYGQPLGKILGIALAHELGHVLLPPPSHSAEGIMQPSWEGDAIRRAVGGDIAFTDRQAALMRDRLVSRVPAP